MGLSPIPSLKRMIFFTRPRKRKRVDLPLRQFHSFSYARPQSTHFVDREVALDILCKIDLCFYQAFGSCSIMQNKSKAFFIYGSSYAATFNLDF